MPHRRVIAAVALLTLVPFTAGQARTIEDGLPSQTRSAIEGLIDAWYAEHCAAAEGRPHRLHAPGAIDASPGYRYRDTGAAVLGPPYYISLAATATVFRYEITHIRADARFARVGVRERGASAADRTYERMSSALLVLERQDDGRWLVLAHRSDSMGFPPSLATVPLPDLGPNGSTPQPRCGRFRPGEHAGQVETGAT